MIKCNKVNKVCFTCKNFDKCAKAVSKAFAQLVMKDLNIV